MPECHKCKYNGMGLAICINCKGPDESHRPGYSSSRIARKRALVSIDAIGGVDSRLSLATAIGESPAFNCTEEEEEIVRRAVDELSKLPSDLLVLFFDLYRAERCAGDKRRDARAKIYKLSKSHPRLAKVLNRWILQ